MTLVSHGACLFPFQSQVFLSRLFRLLIAITFTVHSVACAYWLVKEAGSESLEEVSLWVQGHGLEADASLPDKYIVAAYYITTVFTTVGFGDISADNTSERIFTIGTMYMGVIVFGMLLSEVQNAISDLYEYQRQRSRVIHQLKDFLFLHDVPRQLSDTILSWVEFDYAHRQARSFDSMAMMHVPEVLRRSLLSHLHHDALYKVPFLRQLSSNFREDFLVDLFSRMITMTFPPGFPIASRAIDGNRMYLIKFGIIRVALMDGSTIETLNPGDFFGENCLLGENSWRTKAGMLVEYVSTTFVSCLILSRDMFVQTMSEYPRCVQEDIECEAKRLTGTRRLQARQRQAGDGDSLAPSTELRRLGRWFALTHKILRVLKDDSRDPLATSARVITRALSNLSALDKSNPPLTPKSSLALSSPTSTEPQVHGLSEANAVRASGFDASEVVGGHAAKGAGEHALSYFEQLESGLIKARGEDLPPLDCLTGLPFGVKRKFYAAGNSALMHGANHGHGHGHGHGPAMGGDLNSDPLSVRYDSTSPSATNVPKHGVNHLPQGQLNNVLDVSQHQDISRFTMLGSRHSGDASAAKHFDEGAQTIADRRICEIESRVAQMQQTMQEQHDVVLHRLDHLSTLLLVRTPSAGYAEYLNQAKTPQFSPPSSPPAAGPSIPDCARTAFVSRAPNPPPRTMPLSGTTSLPKTPVITTPPIRPFGSEHRINWRPVKQSPDALTLSGIILLSARIFIIVDLF